MAIEEWVDVAADADVGANEGFAASAKGRPVALFRIEGAVFALHDLCPHGKARLSEGFVEGDTVECPLHQGLVCIRTGAPRSPPITEPVASFPVRVIHGRIEIRIA
ncbi:MAG TPA: non-heme iron oxygenase ferredoxin subunit [Caulobacteraceae bacterium]|jgi:nitrite reductase/ring-hydroxylating ferredoxin subunit|nr:non-heme iron oxygenase ferredoxin subunit [Caulobacteraceae bacterium]